MECNKNIGEVTFLCPRISCLSPLEKFLLNFVRVAKGRWIWAESLRVEINFVLCLAIIT